MNSAEERLDWSSESLLADARAQAGLSDFGDEDFIEAITVLADSISSEAGLHPRGAVNARSRIVDSLVIRLTAQDHFKRYPEILREEILAPIFIVGLARSGTTRLLRLLAVDSSLYAAKRWECRYPSPFPGSDWTSGLDPRIPAGREDVQQMLAHQPVLASIHPFDADAPDEEIVLMQHSFMSQGEEASARVPTYVAWLDRQDHVQAYSFLKRMLQFLQWQKKRSGHPAERWVLKGPFHLGYLDALFSVFPDAQLVQTHRDPVETIPSIASFHFALWQMSTDGADPTYVGRQSKNRFVWALDRCMELRDERFESRCLDVWYQDVNRDPLAEAQRIFDFVGRDLSAETEQRMRHWLIDNDRKKRPPHRYDAEQFGLSKRELAAAFSDYRQRFLPEEFRTG